MVFSRDFSQHLFNRGVSEWIVPGWINECPFHGAPLPADLLPLPSDRHL